MSGELGPPGDPPDDDRGHERCKKCHAILDPESPFCPDCVVVVRTPVDVFMCYRCKGAVPAGERCDCRGAG